MIIQLLHISCIVAGLKENNVDCMIISLEIYSLYPYMQIKNDHVLQCIYIFSRFNWLILVGISLVFHCHDKDII